MPANAALAAVTTTFARALTVFVLETAGAVAGTAVRGGFAQRLAGEALREDSFGSGGVGAAVGGGEDACDFGGWCFPRWCAVGGGGVFFGVEGVERVEPVGFVGGVGSG